MTTASPAQRRRNTTRSISPEEQRRARQLVSQEVEFVGNDSFTDPARQKELLAPVEINRESATPPRDLPGHLARLCQAPLLTPTEEVALFRQMNFLKCRANQLRSRINPDRPNRKLLDEIELLLKRALEVRDRIVQANMRLVIAIVKKFVTPQFSFDDLLSDGIMSLMQAADKFDFDRGFRFSTYAYRAIARNTYRMINDRQKDSNRFATGTDYLVLDAPLEDRTSLLNEHAWERMRGLLKKMMEKLDRREQFIMRSRYALGGHRKVRTFQCLADKLGVSKERVRQLEQRAVAKLQQFASQLEIEDMVEPAFAP